MDLGLFNVSDTYQYVLNQSGANAITLGNGGNVDWNSAGVVTLAGDQTIVGTKTFTNSIAFNGNITVTASTVNEGGQLTLLGGGSSYPVYFDNYDGNARIFGGSGPSVFATFKSNGIVSIGGNVGIGTDNPVSSLDVRGLIANYVGLAGTQQILQNWGYSNAVPRWKPVIEANASFAFYGYDDAGGTPALRVAIMNNNGNVGIGTSSPTEKLHVSGNIISNNLLLQGDTTNGYIRTTNTSSNLYLGANNATVLTILANGNVGIGTTTPAYQLQLTTNSAAKPTSTAWTVPSDKRIKKNIRPYTKGLNSLITINPVLYDYNGKINFEQTVDHVGLIAQDIKDEFPECINTFKAKLNPNDKEDTDLLNFDSHALTFVLINSIKELKQIIDAQNLRILELESKLL